MTDEEVNRAFIKLLRKKVIGLVTIIHLVLDLVTGKNGSQKQVKRDLLIQLKKKR